MPNYDFDLPFFFRFFGPGFDEDAPRVSPAGLNIHETKPASPSQGGGELVVEAPVPGVKKDEVTVEVREGVLKIDAAHRESEEEKKVKAAIYRAQRVSEFHYSTTLPKEVEEDHAKAKLEDGVLKVRLPLKTGAKEKRATVPIEGE